MIIIGVFILCFFPLWIINFYRIFEVLPAEAILRDRSLFIERGGGGVLVQIRGGSLFFMQKFKGGPQENMQMYKPIKC